MRSRYRRGIRNIIRYGLLLIILTVAAVAVLNGITAMISWVFDDFDKTKQRYINGYVSAMSDEKLKEMAGASGTNRR